MRSYLKRLIFQKSVAILPYRVKGANRFREYVFKQTLFPYFLWRIRGICTCAPSLACYKTSNQPLHYCTGHAWSIFGYLASIHLYTTPLQSINNMH